MADDRTRFPDAALDEARAQLLKAAAAKKCWSCGCLRSSLEAIERAPSGGDLPERFKQAIQAARLRLEEVRYDCLGCAVCFPALAMNALDDSDGGGLLGTEVCSAGDVDARDGWPPLPGDYTVLRYQAPVAICTLTDRSLASLLTERVREEVAIVGTLQTENLGVERVIRNTLANPRIRFLILCGADSRQRMGHLPGQSLLALARSGVDDAGRIVGAPGKRPYLRNLAPGAVDHFKESTEVLDLVGEESTDAILEAVHQCAGRDPGPAAPHAPEQVVRSIPGYLPDRMVPDPAGYFVVFADRGRGRLSLEHYRRDGVLDSVIEGHTAGELYTPAVERGLVSRLDHAAYLGRELTRAEEALRTGEPYVQDGAPERPDTDRDDCACGPTCGENAP